RGSKRGQGAGTLEVCSAAASWQWAPGFTLLHPLSFPAPLPYRQVFDSDDNKFIDPAEFKKTLQSLGFTGEGRPALTDEEIEFLFSTTDKDSNQMIDFKEFVDRFWELDLYQKEDGNFVPYLPRKDEEPPTLEAGASPFAPYPRRDDDYLFFGKSTPLDNVRTMKVGPPSACDTSFLPGTPEGAI
ncbi:hypothetical protein Naga_100959g1, partial [Nannochloropsis gaditana]